MMKFTNPVLTAPRDGGITLRRADTIALIACAVAFALMLTACSTTEGFGNDVKKLGNNIEDSAERNK